MKKLLFLFLLTLVSYSGKSQSAYGDSTDTTELYLFVENAKGVYITGQLANYSFLEVGYHSTSMSEAFIGWGHSVGVMSNLNKNMIGGVRAGFWVQFLAFHFENSLVYYNNFNQEQSFHWQPEVSIGHPLVKVSYAYQLPIVNKEMYGLSRHNVKLVLRLPLVTKGE